MRIGGLQKNSFIDFPGKLAAVVFTRGCNLRCPWCHNPNLLEAGGETNRAFVAGGAAENKRGSSEPQDAAQGPECDLSPAEFFAFLEKRQGQLEGVVISGGEPTIHSDLPEFAAAIRQRGYALKLDTNGLNPQMLQCLLKAGLLDYLAMDLKTVFAGYSAFGAEGKGTEKALLASMRLIGESGIPAEFRITCASPFVRAPVVAELAAQIAAHAPKVPLWLQAARWENALYPDYPARFPAPDLDELRQAALTSLIDCRIR